MALVDEKQVEYVTWFAPASGRQSLIRGKIENVQSVPEQVVLYRGKKTEIAVARPFQSCAVAAAGEDRDIKAGFSPEPLRAKAALLEKGRVSLGGESDALLAIMKNIDVLRIARSVAIESDRAGYVAFGVAMRRQKRQDLALNFRERHGKPLQSARPRDGCACSLRGVAPRR
ncbi:MAG TPA: hypothetical protein VKV96_19950 [Roseiarcus sp.]|nr:hypothetical protein [Roseiarcus sp.]